MKCPQVQKTLHSIALLSWMSAVCCLLSAVCSNYCAAGCDHIVMHGMEASKSLLLIHPLESILKKGPLKFNDAVCGCVIHFSKLMQCDNISYLKKESENVCLHINIIGNNTSIRRNRND